MDPRSIDQSSVDRNAGGEEDFLYPWEFGEQERFFHHWTSTGSTMDRARELAGRGCPGGTVITAEAQTAGRGRNGRCWMSHPGGLFFTLLERPRCPVRDAPLLGMAAQIAAAETLSALCGAEVSLKWPNDLFLGGKKIGGILSELYGEGDRIQWIALGIGLNLNNPVPPGESANCADFLEHPLPRRLVLLRFLETWRGIQSACPGREELRKRWNRRSLGMGQRVLVVPGDHGNFGFPRERVRGRGIFLGIDGSGRGLIQSGGGVLRISPGAASLRFM
ncbi:MAG: biotin--[acetyl-CoA-carboxylase] ligase [Spirochaetaceae bacterium]|nr:biotin--[acetyl-CoA-carboxylase] ligase [Spirochaetaceae bacterium]